jgi:DNA-binding transcriptional ArsR family regulator
VTTTPKFDELIHAPTRLSLVAFLAATSWADFALLRDSIGLSDFALSKQLTTLEEVGYVEIRKAFVGKRPRTSARLTTAGRTAFDQHVLPLQEIVAGGRAGPCLHDCVTHSPTGISDRISEPGDNPGH